MMQAQTSQMPITLGMWLVALLPLAAILVLLVGLRWKAATAGPVGYLLAVIIAFTLYQTSAQNVALQTVKGIWDALFIIYVIVPALLLYYVSDKARAFDTLRQEIEIYTPNDLLHVLGFGWVFSSFLQGITGFGAPIAVTAPLLVAVGVKPIWAVVIPLIGHAWNNTFGTLAVAWEGLSLVTDVQDPTMTAVIAAVMLFVGNLPAGFTIAWMFGRGKAIREALPLILIISAIHGIGQIILAPLVPTLAGFVPGAIAVVALLWLARSKWYREQTEVEDSPVMQEGAGPQQGGDDRPTEEERAATMNDWMAFAPYIVLLALILLVQLIPPIREGPETFEIGLPFPAMETGLGVIVEEEGAYSAFSPLTHPGTFLLISAFFAYILYRSKGYLERKKVGPVLSETVKTGIPAAMALLALVPLALVMEGSGQIIQLALGIAEVASPPVYAFLAPLVGGLGTFITSSNMSSNILLGPLQNQTAAALGLAQAVILAAQTAGGAIANSTAPSNVLLGTGAAGVPGEEGLAIRKIIVYVVAFLVLAGLLSLAATWIVPGG
ncbi:MAG TPA: L-lactate permease [Chloroflexi bacterium]|jgi:lactate permease|nr:L-lactate permease [Chloroflexota bacterium]